MVGRFGRAGGEGEPLPLLRRDSSLNLDPSLIFALAALVVWSVVFVRGLVGLARVRVLVPRAGVAASPPLSVTAIVPARDEVEVIERSIGALLREPVQGIIAVDDRSSDGTRERLAALAGSMLTIVDGVEPGPGQCGKPAALVRALETAPAATEWLLFVDADVVLAPGAVAALVDAGVDRDLVSVIPRVEMKSALEGLLMPAVGALVMAVHPPAEVGTRPGRAFANGQVILVRRAIYERAGGHRAVIGEILEDVRLAERVASAGGRLLMADGRALASTHMYAGWRQLVEGWSKNLYLLTGGRRISAWKWVVLTLGLAWLGPAAAIAAYPVGLGVWAAIVAMQAVLRYRGGAPAHWAVLAPISAVSTAWILLRSMHLHTARRPIAWKGRSY